MRKNIILTGLPHSGKSTLLLNILAYSTYRRNATLITQEILENNGRVGFRMFTPVPFDSVNSTNSTIAHIDISKKYQVGKYGVKVEEIDFWSNKYLEYLEKTDLLPNRINYLDMKSDHNMNLVHALEKTCTCGFYGKYKKFGLCSHLLACEEYYSL